MGRGGVVTELGGQQELLISIAEGLAENGLRNAFAVDG